jgi:DNA-binding NarL/FixJ family response regulator
VGATPTPCTTGKIRVLVVDDHKVVRQGLSRLLAAEPDMEIVGEAADGKVAVELTRQLIPDVVLMDISMPVLNGIEATRVIHAECPAVRVIGLSMFEEAEQALAMQDAGAVAYLTKSGPAEALVIAIRACAGTRRESEGRKESAAES